MYRYYKGGYKNPFNKEKQNAEYMFWFYESVFETLFNRCENTDWYDYFDNEEMGDRFMQILSDVDYEMLAHGKKKQVFYLWLEYLFAHNRTVNMAGRTGTEKTIYDRNYNKYGKS